MNKKALEVQFNWLFVLVAGAIILLFFTVIIVKQKSVSEKSARVTVLKNIEAIIAGASVTLDTTKLDEIPNSDIEVECNRVAIEGVSKQYQNLILFAPNLIKGNKLVWQTMTFNMPYRATNLLYMTSPQIRYIIIDNNNLAKELIKLLPSSLKKELYDPEKGQETQNQNNYKVRFIFFENFNANRIDLKSLEAMQDEDITAIKIIGSLNKGEIEFYQKKSTFFELKDKSNYLTKASLLGAVYSENAETYECNMKNVLNKLIFVSRIYGYKTQKLKDALSVKEECKKSYAEMLPNLRIIDTESSKLIASRNFNDKKLEFDRILIASEALDGENKELQKFSCSLVY